MYGFNMDIVMLQYFTKRSCQRQNNLHKVNLRLEHTPATSSKLRYDTTRDAILTCAQKPT